MAGTYHQNYLHIVFAVKFRKALIDPAWEERLYKFITGLVQNKGQKMLAINGMPDHIHILIGMEPSCRLSDLVREIKKSSNNFINENNFCPSGFYWQKGFGSFTYGHSQLGVIIPYILNQKKHHSKKTFRMEYTQFLKRYEIDYDDRYLFDWIDY
jgi:putative transposase